MPAKFRSDELYRLVFERQHHADEPNWNELNEYYDGRIGYCLCAPWILPVNPYSALMYYIETIIFKIYAANTWPRMDLGEEDPVIDTFDEPPAGCD